MTEWWLSAFYRTDATSPPNSCAAVSLWIGPSSRVESTGILRPPMHERDYGGPMLVSAAGFHPKLKCLEECPNNGDPTNNEGETDIEPMNDLHHEGPCSLTFSHFASTVSAAPRSSRSR